MSFAAYQRKKLASLKSRATRYDLDMSTMQNIVAELCDIVSYMYSEDDEPEVDDLED